MPDNDSAPTENKAGEHMHDPSTGPIPAVQSSRGSFHTPPDNNAPDLPTQERFRAEALVNISRLLAESSDESVILSAIVEYARQVLAADRATIGLLDQEDRYLNIVSHTGFPHSLLPADGRLSFLMETDLVAQKVYREARSIAIPNVNLDPLTRASETIRHLGVTSMLVAPLKHQDQVLGSLYVDYTSVYHEWTAEEIGWLEALAGQGAIALVLARMIRHQQRDIALREVLHTASQQLQAASDLEMVLKCTLDGLSKVLPCIGASIHLLDKTGTEATIAAIWGFDSYADAVPGFIGRKYTADNSPLNRRTLVERQAFFLCDFQVEARGQFDPGFPTLRSWLSVPLLSNNRCLGKITVDHDQPNMYGPEELAIVQTFASHAASALERAYLYTEARDRAERLDALNDIGQHLVGATHLPELYETLYSHISRVFNSDCFFICLSYSDREKIEIPFLVDDGVTFPPEILPPQPGPTSYLLRTGEAMMLSTRSEWDTYGSSPIGNLERRSESALFAPLKWHDLTLGVISVQSYSQHAYSAEEFQMFQALGTVAALAIARIRSEYGISERASHFAALAESARALVANLELHDVLQAVADRAHEMTGGEAFVLMYNKEDNALVVTTFSGVSPYHKAINKGVSLSASEGIAGATFAEQKTFVVQDMQADVRVQRRDETPMRALVALPLSVGEQRMGVLEIAWPELAAVTPERLELATAFADHAALAVHNAQQHEEIRRRDAERTALLRQVLNAQEAERKRISLDLHDGPLQSLGVSLLNIDLIRKRAQNGIVALSELHPLRADLKDIVGEIRVLIADLRPEVLDAYGLVPALEAYIRRLRESTNLTIELEDGLSDRLPLLIEVLIYRLVQEALSNVRKHATATCVKISIGLEEATRTAITRVQDNGKGFVPENVPTKAHGYGVGLSSMLERCESAGGAMRIDSAPNAGTTLTFEIPVPHTLIRKGTDLLTLVNNED
ncbi:MAG: GAF domain-containing protein [Chloroflexi bacterium]|nr:GAF domain-containing protein [Chloroflexota bacterium]